MTHRQAPRGSKLIGGLLLFLAAGAVSQLLAKRMTTGDENSDQFTLAGIIGGSEFTSQAGGLRSGSGLAIVGGLEIDLREATLDPAGATLVVTAYVGGIQVHVPSGWAVEVDAHAHAGGIESRLVDPSELPADAPRLHVTATAWFGGIEIRDARPRG